MDANIIVEDFAPHIDISEITRNREPAKDKPKLKLSPISFGDFRADYPELRPIVIDGVCREGETVNIIAASKVGKSWLSMDLAMAVATGKPWLGFLTEPGKVLLIDNELHPETLSSRLGSVSWARRYDTAKLNANLHVQSMRGDNVSLIALAAALDEIEPGDFKMIILDAFYRFLPEGTSENDNGQMMALYNLLDQAARRLGCVFIIIHHASKGEQAHKAVTDVGSGAGSMARATDSHLVIRPHAEEGYAVLEAAVRSFPPMDPVSIRYEHPLWIPCDVEPQVAAKGSREAKQAKLDVETKKTLLTILSKSKRGMTQSQMRTKSPFGASRVERGCFLLEEAELIECRKVKRNGKSIEVYQLIAESEA